MPKVQAANGGDVSSVQIVESLKEADEVCQIAQRQAEALLTGLQAILESKDQSNRVHLTHAARLCEQIDGIFFSLMNDINCIAARHGAHYTPQS